MESAEHYIASKPQWEKGLNTLRALLLEYPFEECIKWNAPVYMAHGRNLLGLAAFKNHFGLWFFEGASLDDPAGVLTNAQQGKTKNMRQWKFYDPADPDRDLIRTYLEEALKKAEITPAPARTKKTANRATDPFPSALLSHVLREHPELDKAYKSFPTYKQREFREYLEDAKREDTRHRRLQKVIILISKGEGLHDKYR